MSIQSNYADDAKEMTILVDGRFDFSHHKDFRDAYKSAPHGVNFVVDLTKTQYMDSSALGMLLLLREHAGGDSSKVFIIGCSDEIRKILNLSNFNKMFNIK